MANPLPAVRSFLPHAQARRRLCRQSFGIDHFLNGDHVGDHDVIAVRGRFEIAQRELAQIQMFDQRYFAGAIPRSIRMNRLKSVGDLAFHDFPVLRLEVGPHLSFHFLAFRCPSHGGSIGLGLEVNS